MDESFEEFHRRVQAHIAERQREYEAQERQRSIMWRRAFLTSDRLPSDMRRKLRKELDALEAGDES